MIDEPIPASPAPGVAAKRVKADREGLDQALAFVAAGRAVMPLHVPVAPFPAQACSCGGAKCKARGKHPRLAHGTKEASNDPAVVEGWASKWSRLNWGMATGAGADGEIWIVLDIDAGKGGWEALAELVAQYGELPPTVQVVTGSGGAHFYFKTFGPVQNSVQRVGKGIDVRGTGGLVVVPPSMHETGNAYTWAEGRALGEVEVLPCPAWLLGLAARKNPTKKDRAAQANIDSGEEIEGDVDGADDTGEAAPKKTRAARAARTVRQHDETGEVIYAEGGRNDALTSLAGAMRRRGMSAEAIRAALLVENRTRCTPPLDDEEVEVIGASVGRYEPDVTEASRMARRFGRADHVELAEATLEALGPAPVTHDEGDFWRYHDPSGTWKRLPLEQVEHVVAGFAGCPIGGNNGDRPLKLTASTISGAARIARNQVITDPGRMRFQSVVHGVAFTNGFLEISTGVARLVPHSPSHGARFSLPFDFDRDARAPLLEQFWSDVFGDVSEEEASLRVMLLQEFAGACLFGLAPRFQMALVLLGPGGNGKSQAIEMLRALLPEGSTSAIKPHDWGERFRVADLAGKLGNFCNELPAEREIVANDIIKDVISGDPIQAERKNQAPFEFSSTCGHIFSANTLPTTNDLTDGFFRRLACVAFSRRMTGQGRVLDIGKKIVSAERAGLTAWAVRGVERLIRQGAYTTPETSIEAMEDWRDESDPSRAFLKEYLLLNSDFQSCTASELYSAYSTWATKNGHGVMSSTKFGRRAAASGLVHRVKGRESYTYTKVVHHA